MIIDAWRAAEDREDRWQARVASPAEWNQLAHRRSGACHDEAFAGFQRAHDSTALVAQFALRNLPHFSNGLRFGRWYLDKTERLGYSIRCLQSKPAGGASSSFQAIMSLGTCTRATASSVPQRQYFA